MLPAVLEIYVVWHPDDTQGVSIASELVAHFRGTSFTGLIGGAVEVFIRSAGWQQRDGAPRPIPTPGEPPPNGVRQSEYTAIVPVLGLDLAKVVEVEGPWRSYLNVIATEQAANPRRVGIFPYSITSGATNGTVLGEILGKYQTFAKGPLDSEHDTLAALRARDLSQALAQFVAGDISSRLRVFISHTKREASGEYGDVGALVDLVRDVISGSHLSQFFDASDLQVGTDWAEGIRSSASTSALLALRTDLYASREWCQREVLTAKQCGMPVVVLDGVSHVEQRGSFLMDHVPRTTTTWNGKQWERTSIYRALNLLVDECLKRALWLRQYDLSRNRTDLGVSWWAAHAPEPTTLVTWLIKAAANGGIPDKGKLLRILHPDPPLGLAELEVLQQMLDMTEARHRLDIMTPRQLAARGA